MAVCDCQSKNGRPFFCSIVKEKSSTAVKREGVYRASCLPIGERERETVLIELSNVTEPEKMDGIENKARDRTADLIFIIELDNHTPMGVYTLCLLIYRNTV